jgi:acyl carrier protein
METLSEVTQQIKMILEKMGMESTAIKPESDFAKDLGMDSLDKVDLMMEMENHFEITIPVTETHHIQNLAQAAQYVAQRQRDTGNSVFLGV